MLNLIDVVQERMTNDEQSLIVTILSGERQGDKVMYDGSGDVVYGTSIEGFTMPTKLEPQLFTVEDMECFLQPVEKDPEILILGAGHVHLIHVPFEELQSKVSLSAYTGIIVVTRAHEFDSLCLHQVRHVLPTYVGVMGSHKRIYHAFEVLKAEGWTEEELAMVYAPIGLDLGAQTPEEIALSIVAEYLAVQRHKQGSFLSNTRYTHEV